MKASQSRVKKLRELMQKQGIDLYVMENNDPHESEYLPDHWKEVEWLSGFRGDVATVLITQTEALLWTDSRFFISGEQQLQDTPFKLMKMKVAGVPTVAEWLDEYKAQHDSNCMGGDSRILFGNVVDVNVNLISQLWKDRPALPTNKIEIYPEKLSGEKTADRINRVLTAVEEQGGKDLWLSALDEIAWVLNLRGTDIACTPVFISFLYLSREGSTLFVHEEKLTDEVRRYLAELGIEVKPYDEAAEIPYREMIGPNPIPLMKGIKNPVEIEGYKSALLKDGIALTRFYHWLESRLNAGEEFRINDDGAFGIGNEITEMDLVQKLIDFRREQPLYREESFPAIVAWNEHAAMPHYEPSDDNVTPIVGDGLLLIDTGGQYLDGTTDITRTIGVGKVSRAMKRDYTLVLKGHIRLASAVFPRGTRGDQLDALARIDLWRDGKTYRHGTSHGVGHYLGVHEGPESVRMEHNPQVLCDGMLFSNEPAIYLGGKYGIRHENLVLVRPFDVAKDAPDATPCDPFEQGEFQCLDTLTLCYIDTTCVVKNMLDKDELNWLNSYNKRVYDMVSPHLNEDDRTWLAEKCKAL
jgi:Xaa-Pro aminopeptidase